MVRGVYAAAAGMTTQYKKIDVMGNNIANVNTAGYKQNELSLKTFGDELAARTDDNTKVGTIPLCVVLGEESTDLSDGTQVSTSLNTDLAINGNGYFAVRDGAGAVKYTRSGNFSVDNQGFLILPSGEQLLGANNQPINVGTQNFSVSLDGTVLRQDGTTTRIPLFGADNANIAKRRDGFFDVTGATQANGTIRQGWLENSNTDVIENMTGLMKAQRAFQGNQQAMQVTLQTMDRLVTDVGKV